MPDGTDLPIPAEGWLATNQRCPMCLGREDWFNADCFCNGDRMVPVADLRVPAVSLAECNRRVEEAVTAAIKKADGPHLQAAVHWERSWEELGNAILENAPEDLDGDYSQDAYAIQYVRLLEEQIRVSDRDRASDRARAVEAERQRAIAIVDAEIVDVAHRPMGDYAMPSLIGLRAALIGEATDV